MADHRSYKWRSEDRLSVENSDANQQSGWRAQIFVSILCMGMTCGSTYAQLWEIDNDNWKEINDSEYQQFVNSPFVRIHSPHLIIFVESKRYLVLGERLEDEGNIGCRWETRGLSIPADALYEHTNLATVDLAVDTTHCKKVVEVGTYRRSENPHRRRR